VALKAENPVVGGTFLRRAAIRSPNFLAGVSGWTINQDGSAEFNNVIIRNGQVVSGTSLYYSGPPALGNLVASIASANGTDLFGNAYLAGNVSYLGGASFSAVQLSGGQVRFQTAPAAGGPWTQGPVINANITDLFLAAPGGSIHATALFRAESGLVVIGGETADSVAVSGAGGGLLKVTETGGAPAAPPLQVISHTAGDRAMGAEVTGDTNFRWRIDSNGLMVWSSGAAGPDVQLSRSAANTLQLATADLDIATAGRGLQIKEGANARMGTATLAGGTVVVANTSVTVNTRIFLTAFTNGAAPGALRVSARTAGTSFTITSTSATDTSVVAWLLVEPG